jgi:hypothetical protein
LENAKDAARPQRQHKRLRKGMGLSGGGFRREFRFRGPPGGWSTCRKLVTHAELISFLETELLAVLKVHHDTTTKAPPSRRVPDFRRGPRDAIRDTRAVIAFSGPDIARSTQSPIRSKVPTPLRTTRRWPQWTDGVEFLVGQAAAASRAACKSTRAARRALDEFLKAIICLTHKPISTIAPIPPVAAR